MHGDFRPRSTATWAVWGSAFVAVALLMAWKFQWFGGSDPSVVEADSANDNNTVANNDSKNSEPPSPEVFDGQSEPGAFDGSNTAIPSRFGTIAMRKKFSDAPWDAATDRPPGDSVGSNGSELSASNYGSKSHRLQPASESQYLKNGGVQTAGYDSTRRGDFNRRPANRNGSNPIVRTGFDSQDRRAPAGRVNAPVGNGPLNNQADSRPPATLIAKIDQFLQHGEILAAHKELSSIYWKRPEWRRSIRSRIEQTASTIYFSPRRHFMPPHVVRPNEYLSTIAARYNVPYQYLERLNGVQGKQIQAGQKLKVIEGPFAVVVDLSDRELTLHHKGWFVARFPVGIGRDHRSPAGRFRVEAKVENPPYTDFNAVRSEDRTIRGGDPRNPLGSHWIEFDRSRSFGIHGTNDPRSIGRAESKGCIRMHNNHVAWVYDMLTKGSEILVQD